MIELLRSIAASLALVLIIIAPTYFFIAHALPPR